MTADYNGKNSQAFPMSRWVNFLSLTPGTTLTILVISIAFLRFYDETDFTILGQLAHPKAWSNRLTVAAILVALVNFSLEWNERNRETDRRVAEAEFRVRQENFIASEEQRRVEEEQRRVEEEQRRVEEEQRRVESQEQETRRTRIETERDLAFLSFLVDPSDQNRYKLAQVLAVLSDYRDTLKSG
jgi:hypothetical protein